MSGARMLATTMLLGLAACGPAGLLTGAAATGGVMLADERPVGVVFDDSAIELAILDRWAARGFTTFHRLNATVHEGRALLTGVTDDDSEWAAALTLAWQVDGVRAVINEIRLGATRDLADRAGDIWIATQLRTRLQLDIDILSVNYAIEAVDRTLYVIGIARDRDELSRVRAHARQIPTVRGFVSHVRVRDPAAAPQPAGGRR